MSEGRERLLPWLIQMTDNNNVPGLHWLNEERTLLRMPWKHQGKHDWKPSDSRLLMEYAKVTGKYVEGIDRPNYAMWKTRLRCALNKHPYIRLLRELSKLDCEDPFKVYRILPRKSNLCISKSSSESDLDVNKQNESSNDSISDQELSPTCHITSLKQEPESYIRLDVDDIPENELLFAKSWYGGNLHFIKLDYPEYTQHASSNLNTSGGYMRIKSENEDMTSSCIYESIKSEPDTSSSSSDNWYSTSYSLIYNPHE